MQIHWMRRALVAATLLAVPAFGQIGIYIGTPPPPLRYEVQPPMPGPGYVWNEGYWNNEGGRYHWMPGVWNRPPYEGANWNHPHYDHYRQGWQMHQGHWDNQGPGNGRGNDGHGNNGHGNDGHGNQGDHGHGH